MALTQQDERIATLEAAVKRLERELVELREEHQTAAGVWELQYNRLVAYMEGRFEPSLSARGNKTARDPIRVADFAGRKGMGS